ncbi:MAG: DUF664 domain-containing protein [SAR202 cluster bacterium]|nr:DUF664 domain-containing protein [SAR202 cluster bacterium]
MIPTPTAPQVWAIAAGMERCFETVTRAIEGLRPDQLYYLPTPESNSIAWMAWSLSRWKDVYTGALTGEPQAWASEGWAGRYGMSAEATGYRDTPEMVAAFRPDVGLLRPYAAAAHRAAMRRLGMVTEAHLAREFVVPYGTLTGARLLINMLTGFMQHTGSIGYVRGMVTGRGWNEPPAARA